MGENRSKTKSSHEIDIYVENQGQVLEAKLAEIEQITRSLNLFKDNLKEEQTLSKYCNMKINQYADDNLK